MIHQLEALGLSADEARVYISLLELGGGHVSQIAKKAGKHRATCYHTLGNLVSKGLASKVEKRKSLFFNPEPPEKLISQASQRLQTAQALLPELASIQNTLAKKPKIKFFEGLAGLEAILEDTLEADGEILGYTNLSLMLTLFPDLLERYTKLKLERNIKTRFLSPRLPPDLTIDNKFLKQAAERDLLEILFIDPEQFPFQNEIAIYGNKVAFMSLSRDESIAILIESQSVSSTMKAVFDISWLGATSFVAR